MKLGLTISISNSTPGHHQKLSNYAETVLPTSKKKKRGGGEQIIWNSTTIQILLLHIIKSYFTELLPPNNTITKSQFFTTVPTY
jgi:hypothetical protein